MQIPLYQRTELPPARAGMAKPSYELADRSGQRRFGQTLAKFSGAVVDKIIKTQAANEESESMGQVNSLIESFQTIVADKPNASMEELQQEWNRIKVQIKTIPGQLKSKLAKTNVRNSLNLNMPLIEQRAQTQMEAIKSKQELARSMAIEENLINNFNIPELEKHTEEMIISGMYDREAAEARLEGQIDTINIAKERFELKQAKEAITAQYQAIIDSGGTKREAYTVIDEAAELGIIPPSVKRILSENVRGYALRRERQAAATKYEKNMTSYVELTNKILAGEEVDYDDIELSFSDDTKGREIKEKWEGYIQGAYDDQPTKTKSKGYTSMLNTVFQYRRLDISKRQEAYDLLLTERFIEPKRITDDDLKWAMDKIENPYPKHLTPDIEAVLETNTKIIQEWWGTAEEKEQTMQVNKKFLDWIDNELANNREVTHKMIDEKSEDLTGSIKEKIVLNWFEKLILSETKFLPWTFTEQKRLVKKKMAALKEKPVWETMTEQEKKTVQKAFEQGKTIQDVLDLIE